MEYPDFLFSLPMGAGKTFLMAAIIYLDLYFALNEPDNKNFAHNFLILAPSGLKSSIIPIHIDEVHHAACPYCAEPIKKEAISCLHCKKDIVAAG